MRTRVDRISRVSTCHFHSFICQKIVCVAFDMCRWCPSNEQGELATMVALPVLRLARRMPINLLSEGLEI